MSGMRASSRDYIGRSGVRGGSAAVRVRGVTPLASRPAATKGADRPRRICPTCNQAVVVRADGEIQSHRVGYGPGGWSCPGEYAPQRS